MATKKLASLLNPEILCSVDTSDEKEAVVWLEEKKATKLKPIKLVIPTHDCLVFQLDKPGKKFAYKSSFLKPDLKGVHQGCDYVVACWIKNRLQIVLVELKSDCVGGANSQLWHTKPFVQYLIELIRTHFPGNEIEEPIAFRFLRFSTKQADNQKLTTLGKVPSVNDPRGFTVFLGGAPTAFYLGRVLRS